MPIQSTGPLDMSDIQTQFGGANPINFSEYRAGAGLVASGAAGINGDIPSSGPISFSHFRGAPVITQAGSIIVSGTSVTVTAYAQLTLQTDGVSKAYTNANPAPTGASRPNWYSTAPVTDIGDSYEMKWIATTAATTMPGSENVWQALTSVKGFRNEISASGESVAEFDIYIRPVGSSGSGVLYASVTLIANFAA